MKEDNGWLWFGAGVVGAAVGTVLLKPYITQILEPKPQQAQEAQAGPGSSGAGDFYSQDSIEEMTSILAASCGGNPAQVRDNLRMRMPDIQELLDLAEKHQVTQHPQWKGLYEQKMHELCRKTKTSLRAGKMGPTGNLIPAYGQIDLPTHDEESRQFGSFFVKPV